MPARLLNWFILKNTFFVTFVDGWKHLKSTLKSVRRPFWLQLSRFFFFLLLLLLLWRRFIANQSSSSSSYSTLQSETINNNSLYISYIFLVCKKRLSGFGMGRIIISAANIFGQSSIISVLYIQYCTYVVQYIQRAGLWVYSVP